MVGVAMIAFAGGFVGAGVALSTGPASTTLQATRDSLYTTRTECKKLVTLTDDFTTGLAGWMMFAHEDHQESAD